VVRLTGTSWRALATSRSDGATSAPKPPNKYANKPEWVDGNRFDSQAEADEYRELRIQERAGLIADLELQPRFLFEINGRPVKIRSEKMPNGRQASYRADFRYLDVATGEKIVVDVKGKDTSESRLRRALVEAQFGVVVVVKRRRSRRNRTKSARK
jgi:Protein of unknown function (DUF1064)